MRVFMWIAMAGLALGAEAGAQISQSNLQSRLLGKTIYLRGFYADDKLKFNEQGIPQGATRQGSFTLSGVAVESVRLTGHSLSLRGHRMALVFLKGRPTLTAMRLPARAVSGTTLEDIAIDIEQPASGDYTTALNAIFAANLPELVPQMPPSWQAYARMHFLNELPAVDRAASTAEAGHVLKAPRLKKHTEPDYSDAARAMRYSGTVRLTLSVDRNGNPFDISIQEPIGLGLDEQAIQNVARWTFEPATRDGKPIAASLSVDVSFEVVSGVS